VPHTFREVTVYRLFNKDHGMAQDSDRVFEYHTEGPGPGNSPLPDTEATTRLYRAPRSLIVALAVTLAGLVMVSCARAGPQHVATNRIVDTFANVDHVEWKHEIQLVRADLGVRYKYNMKLEKWKGGLFTANHWPDFRSWNDVWIDYLFQPGDIAGDQYIVNDWPGGPPCVFYPGSDFEAIWPFDTDPVGSALGDAGEAC
jgi:hypothetical protein